MVMLIFAFAQYYTSYRVRVFIALQSLYIVYMYFITSFEHKIDQIIEITCEIVYLVLLVLLTQYKAANDWTNVPTYTFLGIILSFSWILWAFSTYRLIHNIIKFYIRHRNNRKRQNTNQSENESQGFSVDISNEVNADFCINGSRINPHTNTHRINHINSVEIAASWQGDEKFESRNNNVM